MIDAQIWLSAFFYSFTRMTFNTQLRRLNVYVLARLRFDVILYHSQWHRPPKIPHYSSNYTPNSRFFPGF